MKLFNLTLPRIVAVTLGVILAFSLSGCRGGRELVQLPIVLGMGVDASDEPGLIELTAQVARCTEPACAQGNQASEARKTYWNVEGTGETVFAAVRDLTDVTGHRLFVAHCQVVIFGRELAMAGLGRALDFFVRAREMRPSTLFLVAKEDAVSLLEDGSGVARYPAMVCADLIRTYGWTSDTREVHLDDFTNTLLGGITAPTMPLMEIVRASGGTPEHKVAGIAVFDRDRMIGTLDRTQSRGLLWVLGELKSAALVVPAMDGLAALEVLNAKTRVKAILQDGIPTVSVEVNCNLSLADQTTRANLANRIAFSALESAAGEAIKAEIVSTFAVTQGMGADAYGFGELFHRHYPAYWNQVKDDWKTIYRSLGLSVAVKAKVRNTGVIGPPVIGEPQ